MNNVESAIKNLLSHKPFYAHFYLNSVIKYDTPGVTTAAVGLTTSGPVMHFSRAFISDLSPEELSGVIEHETLHLLFDHLSSMNDKNTIPKIANIAMDLSINQYISNLPKEALFLDQFNKTFNLNMLPEQTWEYYYSYLLQAAKDYTGSDSFDQHIGSLDDPRLTPDMKKAILREVVESAAKEAKGNVPEQLVKVIESLRNTHQVSWKQVLNNFVSKCVANTTQNTRKKTNRRFGLDQPGKKKKRELILGVCVDSSGSVSDNDYDKFMAEVVQLSKIASKIYIVEADCVVQNIDTVKKGKSFKLQRKGCGGTAYQPAISKCSELKCDAILYFGDFDSSDTPNNPGVPFLWVGVGDSPKPADFGSEIRLK